MDLSELLRQFLSAELHIGDSTILWREIVGNGFGLASAILGMQRRVAAWPIGIVGNVLLFTVFLGGVFDTPNDLDLYGQAGRQIFFLAVSVYGWVRWHQFKHSHGDEGVGVRPRWAGMSGRLQLLGGAIVMTTVFYFILKALGSWGPLPDAWILTGSILATYGMARGLGRVLVGLDRGGPGRRTAAAERAALPVGADVHRLRRDLRGRVRLLAADRASRASADRPTEGRRRSGDRNRGVVVDPDGRCFSAHLRGGRAGPDARRQRRVGAGGGRGGGIRSCSTQ